MRILIAGGSGFIGGELSKYLSSRHELTLLTRIAKQNLGAYKYLITWQQLTQENIANYDIIINLCGYNIGKKRWGRTVKNKILSSRIEPTNKLIQLIGDKNIWLINASAIGYYNFSKLAQDEDNHDRSYDGLNFGQEVVDQWEKCLVDSQLQRYTILRFGVVIGNGGVLGKMALPAKFGFLIMFGDGHNYMSWVSAYDLSRAIEFIIDKKLDGKGVFNLTAPNASQHKLLVELLRKYLAKKRIIKIPAAIVKLIFGQMGEELLLSNQNIKPTKLQSLGFIFEDSQLQQALERYI
ncbi:MULTISPECIES: TIGR01777 family oxidoreductase [Francisella]|uniref:TIGR01777 family protein n=1 Tax=Francisella opportunistica TaxID=2016517 RepID=A0A345JT68_9GAMM|nr:MULTISPECIES: TIGR01777 family oxidoreductase [Francisella]APC92307.1 Putative nucleoside-diphosphate sugar epimerase [Francisella sp. MA067296]AXH30514.1 TIGR01777 family protein [Francisella opportunistica]AXH32155.1 TIGR01777 family protein [Francisella opportunistica]AXH33804.1 TIGR01777 family protein [Francisella opportunistica]